MPVGLATGPLPRSTPEQEGLSSKAILDFLAAAEVQGPNQELHSYMVVRNGAVVSEGWWTPYSAGRRHLLFSLSKSFTSSAIGIAVSEGRLTLDDAVISFFPDKSPPNPSRHLRDMRVRHLLSMSTGQTSEPWPNLDGRNSPDWVTSFLNHPVEHEPGTTFLYNSIATFMLSAILQRLTETTTLEYLRPRLLQPLGITEATWDLNPDGIVVGGWGMSICTESIAKFGQLYLQDGVWNGTRLLPEGWVAEATRSHIDNSQNENPDWRVGYGYQFWRCRPDCYRADGAFGQLCVVIPQHDMVVAVTGRVESMQDTLDLIWDHLLPAARPSALEPNVGALAELRVRSDTLALQRLAGQRTAEPIQSTVSGRTYEGTDSELGSMKWDFSKYRCELEFTFKGERVFLAVSSLNLNLNRWGYEFDRKQWAAAHGAWTSKNTYVILLQFLEEPGSMLLTSTFEDNRVSVTTEIRGRFVDPVGPSFQGVACAH